MSGHDCPICERIFSTEQGMRQHHTKVHGDPLPNRTCADCEEEFYDPKARRTYCEECYTGAGEQNGNWKDAKERADCRTCGETFEYYPSDKDGVFCPECVEQADEFLGTPSYELADITRVQCTCAQCNEPFMLLESTLNRDERSGRFCSHECKSAWMSENWNGENHHQWLPGETDYSGRWWEVRRLALERDNHCCQSCGTGVEDLNREPDVHHITPVRAFDDSQDAHTLDNVVCLCRECHAKVEAGSLPCPPIE